MATPTMVCEGCGDDFINIFDRVPVCMDCVAARGKCATTWRNTCKCGRKKNPGEVTTVRLGQTGERSWVPCKRCLGTIKQLS